MNGWSLVYEGFDPAEEGLREALCTLGNGYFATRGASSEAKADGIHYPGTYLAGGYNRLRTEIAGKVIENEDLVNLPNWLFLTFRIPEGKWFNIMDVEILSYRQELDLKRGILLRTVRFCHDGGRKTRLTEQRLVHMGKSHLAALKITLTPENWSGDLEICSALDGQVVNAGVERYKGLNNRHLEPIKTEKVGEDTIYLKVQTNQSEIRIAQTARTQVFKDAEPLSINRETIQKAGYIAHQFTVGVAEGKEVSIEKIVALYTSRDHAISECGLEAKKAIARAGRFQDLLESHTLIWKHLWHCFRIELKQGGSPEDCWMEMVPRLYTFHVLQTISMHTKDLDTGVPSRGWHGEAYRGHIFWDELFVFPLLNFRAPEITRSLLMYRYRRLDEARAAAREAGYAGAMYPWQSGSNGREESQKIHLNPKSGRWVPDNSHLQRHVNAAIAYNIWQYYQVTADMEFLSSYGAKMFLEIARFWSSITTYNPEIDRYEILGVMGPDEYHDAYPNAKRPGLNNNAYTNIMAVWVLTKALKLLDILPEGRKKQLCEILNLGDEERRRWQDISHKMRVVFHDDGIISQFEGYEELEELDWKGYGKKYGNIQRLDRILEAEGDTPNRYKVSKQADVLMLFYLFSAKELGELFEKLGYPFEYETIPKNINYYLERTSHGSTLSWLVHSWVLARSNRARSWQLFVEALRSDFMDIQGGTTPEGIHLGAMAGTVDLIQCCYSGMRAGEDMLWFEPRLPQKLTKLGMCIHYRGHSLEVEITARKLKVSALRVVEKPIKIGFKDEVFQLKAGDTVEIVL